MAKERIYYESLYNQIARIVEKAKKEIERANWLEVGQLMKKARNFKKI